MIFIPVSYSMIVLISGLAATAKREGLADDGEGKAEGRPGQAGEGGPMAARTRPRAEGRGFDGVQEKDYICVLALKRV